MSREEIAPLIVGIKYRASIYTMINNKIVINIC